MSESSSKTWCREADGGVYFDASDDEKTEIKRLQTHVRVALAFNDECCERGFGRFYVFVSHEAKRRLKTFETAVALCKIPEVFYVPEIWTSAEQQDWRNGGRRWQMSRSYARNGWVRPDHQPVLPLRLDVRAEQLPYPQFEALTLAPLLVLFSPVPYVAPITEIEALGEMRRKHTKWQWACDIEGEGEVDGWAKIAQWKCRNIADVVAQIEKYCMGSSEAAEERMVWYKSLVQKFARIRVAVEEAYRADQVWGRLNG